MTTFITPADQTEAPKTGKANIYFLLDASGSMGTIREEAISGFNKFVADQLQAPGEAVLTLVLFDSTIRTVFNQVPLSEAKLTEALYVPGGMTAMNDAIGDVLTEMLGAMVENESYQLQILTDGQENASKKYNYASAKSLLEMATNKGWDVTFLGANMEKQSIVSNYGLDANKVAVFEATMQGMNAAMTTASVSNSMYRSAKSVGASTRGIDTQAIYSASVNATEHKFDLTEALTKGFNNLQAAATNLKATSK